MQASEDNAVKPGKTVTARLRWVWRREHFKVLQQHVCYERDDGKYDWRWEDVPVVDGA